MSNLITVNDNIETFMEERSFRDRNSSKLGVLEKVKNLIMLPDRLHVTTEMAANYYEVDLKLIQKVIERHRDELEQNGLQVLSGAELKDYHSYLILMSNNVRPFSSKTRYLTIIPRRALLRIGMLLRDSGVASMVRSYLLNVEMICREEAPEITTDALNKKATTYEEVLQQYLDYLKADKSYSWN